MTINTLEMIASQPMAEPKTVLGGFFVSLEGCEGSGKTTQKNNLVERFRAEGYLVVDTKEPGGTIYADAIRNVLLNGELAKQETLVPEAESLLFWASRTQHLQKKVFPYLAQGAIVFTDRFADSSWAYQVGGRGLSPDWMGAMEKLVIGDLKPDVTLLYDGPIEALLARLPERRRKQMGLDETRIDSEPLEFHRRVHDYFLKLAADEPLRFVTLDAMKTQQELYELSYTALKNKLDSLAR